MRDNTNNGVNDFFQQVISELSEAQEKDISLLLTGTQDYVQVVRCKGCRKRKTPDCPMCEYIRMMRGEDFTVNTCITTNTWRKIDHTTDEDFCSKGKREEDPP